MNQQARHHLHGMRFEALHSALANRLYHQQCAGVFEMRDRLSKLLGLTGASAAFMTLASPETAKWWTLLAFAGSAASLVFRWSEKARLAAEKMIQYASIQADIKRVGDWDYAEVHVNDWAAKLAAITEPAPNRILWDRACYTAAVALKSPDVKPLRWLDVHYPALVLAIP